MHSGSQVISRAAKVGGDLSAWSEGHGLDQTTGSPDLLLSSSQDSSDHSTNGKSNRVGVCPARVSIHAEDAHEAERESIMDDFLSSSSRDRRPGQMAPCSLVHAKSRARFHRRRLPRRRRRRNQEAKRIARETFRS